jgi:hypothetical protein
MYPSMPFHGVVKLLSGRVSCQKTSGQDEGTSLGSGNLDRGSIRLILAGNLRGDRSVDVLLK